MTTSNSARCTASGWWLLALAVLVAVALLLAWIAWSGDHGRSSVRVAFDPAQNRKSLRSALQANFDLATRGTKPGPSGVPAMPQDNSAGLICSPATLDRTSTVRMVLPPLPNDRRGVLAALTPEGGLRIIYVSYGFDTDPEDLSVPYSAIEWRHVRTRNDFAVDVSKFEVLNPDADSSEPLFQDAGIYQFALLNSVDRDMLDNNGASFWVIAGCVIRYQP